MAARTPTPLLALLLLAGCLLACARAQDEQAGQDDDFDDSGFDDSGYAAPARDAEGSQQQPTSYEPAAAADEVELDDDDDVDESHQRPSLTAANQPRRFYHSAEPVRPRYRRSLRRPKRHSSKYIGPVYTYVKTDKYARYKWAVKHKVGKHG